MGDAKHNPRSQQYTGPLPEFAIQPVLGYRMVPGAAWKEANKETLETGGAPAISPSDMDLEIVACAAMVYPSRLIDQRDWPQAAADVGVIATIPFAKFKGLIDAKLGICTQDAAGQRQAAPSLS